MNFLVRSRSSGSEYEITAYKSNGEPVLDCTCPAGENGQYCKHRFALMDGDGSEIVESSHPITDLAALIAGSRLEAALKHVRDQEKVVTAAQGELAKRKKALARAMAGQF